MTSFAKAFISHSSQDKQVVEDVAKRVSSARWEIDAETFEEGKRSASEILNALERSDLFVLFASEHSMASGWVRSELELAQQLLYSRKLGAVLVFIIDGTEPELVPEWIRMHVFVRTSNPIRIANLIRTKLFELDAEKGLQIRPFVQRLKIRGEIERRLGDLTHQVRAIYVSGVDGIGRRSVVSDTFRSLFPGLDLVGMQVSMSDGEGLLEVYRKLYFAFERPTVAESELFFDDVSSISKEELIDRTARIIEDIGSQKMLVWIKFDHDMLGDDGDFQADIRALLRTLKVGRPNLVLCAKRSPRFQEQRRLENVGFFKVDSMTDDESKLLWQYALDYVGVDNRDPAFVNLLRGHVSGHPAMIWMAAEYVAFAKKPAIEANPRELIEALRSLSASLLDGLKLSQTSRRLLALFDEIGAIDPSDLIEICGSAEGDHVIADAVNRLMSLGLLEAEGDHLRLASYFRGARFRKQFAEEVDGFLADARKRLLALTSTYTADDNISFATIDAVLTNAIVQGKPMPLGFGERALVGSHYLRVARGSYDREKYDAAAKFARDALEKRPTLTNEAVVECLRLLGMAAIRVDDNEGMDHAVQELSKIDTQQARRHVHFIKGFGARWNGEFDVAETEFAAALKINQKDTHALREIAQLLVMREDYAAAERYAREAVARTPGNPFVLDILLQCLIELRKGDAKVLSEDAEILDLFSQLDIADRRDRTEFSALRHAHFYAALHNRTEAINWADVAVRKNPGKVGAYALRAEIKLRAKGNLGLLHSAEADIRQIQRLSDESNGARKHASLLAKLRTRFEIAKGNLRSAIKSIDSVPRGNVALKKSLSREIAYAAIEKGEKDAQIVAFANRALS